MKTLDDLYLEERKTAQTVKYANKYRESLKKREIKIGFRFEKECKSIGYEREANPLTHKKGNAIEVANSTHVYESEIWGGRNEVFDGVINELGHFASQFGDTGYFFTFKSDINNEEIEKFYIRN